MAGAMNEGLERPVIFLFAENSGKL